MVDKIHPRRLVAPLALGVLLLSGCAAANGTKQNATTAAAPSATAAVVQATPAPTPAALVLSGTVIANGDGTTPGCAKYKVSAAPVVVRDEANTVIASGTTSGNQAPQPTPLPFDGDDPVNMGAHLTEIVAYDDAHVACTVTFAVPVPRAQFYQLTIGTHGAPTYALSDLEAERWHITLTLGQ